jgi:DNA-directed RNA polymerase subunit beta'
MALTLFEPFIIRRLKDLGYCHTVRSAKKMIDRKTTEVWDILEEVTKGHPVMLNRAPTLHRLSIQAFEPVLIEGSAIRVHPLVCTAYNADFDGDQMAVHVPLSVEAQMECRQLMLAPNNIFSPASGKPITVPSQDIILGSYYLTYARTPTAKEVEARKEIHLPLFENTTEVEFAIASRKVKYHDWIRLRNPDFGKEEKTFFGDHESKIIVTTPGRVRFNEIWPSGLGFLNFNVGKKQIGDIIWRCYQCAGQSSTVKVLDALKSLGFMEATRSGISIGIIDMVVPEEKKPELVKAYAELEKVTKQYRNGVITDNERYQQVIDIWTHASDNIADALYRKLEHNEGDKIVNPLFLMVDSGARGNKQQIKQLSGMRGLMAKPSGDIIERPITSNFREGLSVLEYFISTHGARKGLADTALKTADSGYMTRKLVDVSQDVIVFEEDCGTVNGITAEPIIENDEEAASLSSRIYGRVSGEKVTDPVSGNVILEVGQLIGEHEANKIEDLGFERLKIRSTLTCEADRGCCQKCYGLNLASGEVAKLGEAVGIVAAQSIGEPGTQLTMRTFHVGGVASSSFKQPIIKAKSGGTVVYKEVRAVKDAEGNFVALNKKGAIAIRDKDGLELESYNLVMGSAISIPDGEKVKKGEVFVTWDPYNVPILTEKPGKVEFRDMIKGITVQSETDKETGKKGMVVTEHKEDLHPQIVIVDKKTSEVLASYSIPVGAHLSVKEGSSVKGGAQLARTPRKISKTGDITGGLPRIAELFEARRPKEACTIAKIDGEVSYGPNVRGKKKVIVTDMDTGEHADHLVPMGKHIIVGEGDFLHRGDQITEGPVSPDDLLEACGAQALQEHLTNEVQRVYRLQGVEINDKHIEIVIRQMLRKVKITEPGDTEFLWGDQIDRTTFKKANEEVISQGGAAAESEPVLLGITKASLETESFISAASFQDTTRVLTDASTIGRVDHLRGFKENVIMGHLIPAGTGFHQHRDVDIEFTVEEPEPQQDEPEEGAEGVEGADGEGTVAVEELPLQAKPITAGEESA